MYQEENSIQRGGTAILRKSSFTASLLTKMHGLATYNFKIFAGEHTPG